MKKLGAMVCCAGLLALAPGCGDDLSYDAVWSIGSGDAVGTAASGHYSIRRTTTFCDPGCVEAVGDKQVELCALGREVVDPIELVQQDGWLVLKSDRQLSDWSGTLVGWDWESELPWQMRGGVDRDGGYAIGGSTDSHPPGGEDAPTVRARISGQLAGDGTIQGTIRTYRSAQLFDGYKRIWTMMCRTVEEFAGERSPAP